MCWCFYGTCLIGMSSSKFSVPLDAVPPFGTQSMADVVEQMGDFASRNRFLRDVSILAQGVFVTKRTWNKDSVHKKEIWRVLMKIADRDGSVSLMSHLKFARCFVNESGVQVRLSSYFHSYFSLYIYIFLFCTR